MSPPLGSVIVNTVDPTIAENFRLLEAKIDKLSQLDGFRALECTLTKAGSDMKIYHNLGYIPEDVILSRNTAGVTVVFQYEKFTKDYLVMNVSGPSFLRMLLGKFKGSIKAL